MINDIVFPDNIVMETVEQNGTPSEDLYFDQNLYLILPESAGGATEIVWVG